MKKITAVVLGLGLALASLSFAQDKATTMKKTSSSKKGTTMKKTGMKSTAKM